MAELRDILKSGDIEQINIKQIVMTPVDPATVPNNSLFLDSTDSNKLKFKDSSGGVFYVLVN